MREKLLVKGTIKKVILSLGFVLRSQHGGALIGGGIQGFADPYVHVVTVAALSPRDSVKNT